MSDHPVTEWKRIADFYKKERDEAIARAEKAEAYINAPGEGNYNVLALIDRYQDDVSRLESEIRDLTARAEKAELERDAWGKLARADMGREARFKRQRDDARQEAADWRAYALGESRFPDNSVFPWEKTDE